MACSDLDRLVTEPLSAPVMDPEWIWWSTAMTNHGATI